MRSNIFNEDFREFLLALNEKGVRYLLVGGFAVILHGYSRTTGDMDIWVERTRRTICVYGMLSSSSGCLFSI